MSGIAGTTRVAGREVALRVGVPHTFPLELPVVRLDGAKKFPHTPHVEEDGAVCYVIPQGLVIDRHDPLGVLHYALGRAVETLRRGWEEDADDEFMDEFGAYWRNTRPQHVVDSFLSVDDRVRLVRLKMAPHARQAPRARHASTPATTWAQTQEVRERDRRRNARARRLIEVDRPAPRSLGWVFDDVEDPRAFHQREQQQGWRHALYIPLPREARVRPPRPGERWSAQEVREIVRGKLHPQELEGLDRLAARCGDELLVILALPRPRGGTTLVGLRYFGLKGRHPLAAPGPEDGPWAEPEPVMVQRLDRALVTARGGARPDLGGKCVLLVGCGSVGGHLATMLATAGVGHLTLVDPDRLAWENVFRHVLGKKALGRRKVEALAAELRDRVPYLRVRGVPHTIAQALREGELELGDFDLIVSATGEPTVDLDLNARIQGQGGPPAVFAWLEPFGIGGHAALSTGGQGCFECLYTPPEEDAAEGPFNRAALYAQAQPRDFNLDEVGCGSFYAPFSDLDARQTAELATRLAISALEGREGQSVLRSWKGDSTDFQAAGYVLSARHGLSSDALRAGVDYASPGCRTCRAGRAA
ncbi:ThiF family adenylyltransferase [Deinococcus carri]|uniref:ThiF family adenylyltransferase n=1 Tax=Deinococcus carri TaxID=1211323 RepID=UPI0031ED69F0